MIRASGRAREGDLVRHYPDGLGSVLTVETMRVEVLLADAKPGGVFDVVSYTVFAGGRLELRLADGTVRTWQDDWMDVGLAGSFSPATRKPPGTST